MTEEQRENIRQDEAKRRRDAFDAECERRWNQQVNSDDPPEPDKINGGYI